MKTILKSFCFLVFNLCMKNSKYTQNLKKKLLIFVFKIIKLIKNIYYKYTEEI